MRRTPRNSWPTALSILVAGAMVSGSVLWVGQQLVAKLDRPPAVVAADDTRPARPAPDIADISLADTPFIGDPAAPAVMAYWFDYQCPFCQQVELTVMPKLIEDYVKPGKLRIYFKDFQFLGPDSIAAALAARAVWEVAPDKFYEWHRAMFEKQDDENGGWGTAEDVAALTATIAGIDATKVNELVATKGDEYQRAIDDALAEGKTMGINGTPGAIVGSQLISGAAPYAQFRGAVEDAL
jgi:protein-disulfide isomerase